MDSRHHVSVALVRLLEQPGTWPTRDLTLLRNRLLDETGGDYRTLVVFLVQLAELGMPQAMAFESDGGAGWDDIRNRFALQLTSEHFFRPDMARWGIESWGVATRVRSASLSRDWLPTAPAAPSAVSSSLQTLAHRIGTRVRTPALRSASAIARSATPPTRTSTLAGLPSWVNPAKVPTVARWIPGSHLVPPLPHTSWQPTPSVRRALVGLGVSAAAVIAFISFTFENARSPSKDAEGNGYARVAALEGVSSLRSPTSDANTRANTPSNHVTSWPLHARAQVDPRALEGAFRLTVKRSSVHGDARCGAIATRIRWDQVSVEHIRISEDGMRFAFVDRPGLEGTIGSAGEFAGRSAGSERDGTRSTFILQGRVTPDGFRAIGETRTTTTLRWRHSVACRFIAELVGQRIDSPTSGDPR